MTKEIVETAKAVQEVAKTTSQAIAATEKLGGFVAKTIGEPLQATINILTDHLKFIRWKRQVRLLDRCQEVLRERRIEGKFRIIPPQLALPIISNASFEEDDFLQDLWVSLLISAIDPACEMPRSAFIDILRQLTPLDAKILKVIFEKHNPQKDKDSAAYVKKYVNPKEKTGAEYISPSRIPISADSIISAIFGVNRESYEVSIDNLVRVGCVSLFRDIWVRMHDAETINRKQSNYDQVTITALGVKFVKACMQCKP